MEQISLDDWIAREAIPFSIDSPSTFNVAVDKVITSVGFTGTKSAVVTLKAGKYTYVCDPHASFMKGSFTVG